MILFFKNGEEQLFTIINLFINKHKKIKNKAPTKKKKTSFTSFASFR